MAELTVDLSNEIHERLRAKAAEMGASVDELLLGVVFRATKPKKFNTLELAVKRSMEYLRRVKSLQKRAS